MPLDNAFRAEVQANGGAREAGSGGPGVSFMPKLGATRHVRDKETNTTRVCILPLAENSTVDLAEGLNERTSCSWIQVPRLPSLEGCVTLQVNSEVGCTRRNVRKRGELIGAKVLPSPQFLSRLRRWRNPAG